MTAPVCIYANCAAHNSCVAEGHCLLRVQPAKAFTILTPPAATDYTAALRIPFAASLAAAFIVGAISSALAVGLIVRYWP